MEKTRQFLLVDSPGEKRDLLVKALRRKGYQARSFSDSFSLLNHLRNHSDYAAFIILDPSHGDPRRALMAARSGNPAIASLPLLIYTAHPDITFLAGKYRTELMLAKGSGLEAFWTIISHEESQLVARQPDSLRLSGLDRMQPVARQLCGCPLSVRLAGTCRCGGIS